MTFRKVGAMKVSNRAVSLVVIAAVLLAAGGVGLLIRQARRGNSPPGPQAVAGVDDASSSLSSLRHGLQGGRTPETPQDRAKLKEQRAQVLKKMESLTEEEKEQFRARVSARYSSQSAGQRGFRNLSPEQQEQMARRWQSMSEQEREAFRRQVGGRFTDRRGQREDAAPSSQQEGRDAGQGMETIDSEPNQTNQG